MTVTTEECPGSVPENKHFLSIVSEATGNRICENNRCYFIIKYKDNSGEWVQGFDYVNAESFVKPEMNK